jgi:trk system potassium uptake protein TrkA
MARKQYAVIGMGQTGHYVAKHLAALGHAVLAVDSDGEKIQEITPFVTHGAVADCTKRKLVAALPLQECDAVIVTVGTALENSLLIILNLKELGIKNVIAKASSESHSAILARLGVTDIFHPERDMAISLAERLHRPHLLEYIPFMEGYSIVEWACPDELVGKNLRELNLNNKFHVQVIAIKDALSSDISMIPSATEPLQDTHILYLLGSNEHLDKLLKKME